MEIEEARKKGTHFIEEVPDYLTTVEAARLLSQMTGERWDKRKVHLYHTRGQFPKPDKYKRPQERWGPLWNAEKIRAYAGNRKK